MSTLTNTEKTNIILDSDVRTDGKIIGAIGAMFGLDNDKILHSMISVMNHNDTEKAENQTKKMRKPKDYTKTESIIHDMLTENTGVHMMDSGGVYGRHWQSNRAISDFRNTELVKVEEWNRSYTFSKSVFHYLTEQLTYDPEMTRKFKAFCRRADNRDSGDWVNMEEFGESLHEGNYPEKPINENTYNFECVLSQTLQFVIFTYQNTDYLILQIHGGADVRGGYSSPKVFTYQYGWDSFLGGLRDLRASCDCMEVYSDDSGYHWYDGNNGHEFPNTWHWSNRLSAVYCQDCKKRVDFK